MFIVDIYFDPEIDDIQNQSVLEFFMDEKTDLTEDCYAALNDETWQ